MSSTTRADSLRAAKQIKDKQVRSVVMTSIQSGSTLARVGKNGGHLMLRCSCGARDHQQSISTSASDARAFRGVMRLLKVWNGPRCSGNI